MFIILIVLIVVIFYLSYKLKAVNKHRRASKMVLNTIEHTKDFYYYCKTKPTLQYVYLSKGIEQYFGEGAQFEHIKSPYNAFKALIHPDDLHIAEGKIDGTANFDEPLIVRLKQ